MRDREHPSYNMPYLAHTWDALERQRPSHQEATVSDWCCGTAGIARSVVESPMNVGKSESPGLALFSATRISTRL